MFDPSSSVKCWICGGEATTGEHRAKRSDLKAVLGAPTQAAPLFLNTDQTKNRRIRSLNADRLKFRGRICATCNNARTQPYDRAWQKVSGLLRTRLRQGGPHSSVRMSRLVPYDTTRTLLNLHLFFVKLLGCHIYEADICVDLERFSQAILKGTAHPEVYLGFFRNTHFDGRPSVGMTDIWADTTADGRCVFATSFYEVDNLAINVMFAEDGQKRDGLLSAWHPRFGTTRLLVS